MIEYLRPTLDKYFVYDQIFNLLDYDTRLDDLYNDLKSLTKSSYESNYRFIFLHYDTDYYITNNQPGLLLRNLQRIIWALGIGNYFCLILSQQNLQNELEQLRIEETTEQIPIACITHPLQDLNHFPKLTDNINIDAIHKHYINLTRARRFHRIVLHTLLESNNLLDKGLVSFGSKSY